MDIERHTVSKQPMCCVIDIKTGKILHVLPLVGVTSTNEGVTVYTRHGIRVYPLGTTRVQQVRA